MGFYDLTPGRLCAHCGAELSRYRQRYCTNRCREAVPRSYACNPKGRGIRRTQSQITPAFRAALCGLWADGVPISVMGARLGITKNSVAGFVYRWKLTPRGTPIRRPSSAPSPHPRPLAPVAVERPSPTASRPASLSHGTGPSGPAAISSPPQVTPPPAQCPTPGPRAVPSPPKTCQWIEASEPPWVMCGAPTVEHGPWCAAHRRRCWASLPRPLERAA